MATRRVAAAAGALLALAAGTAVAQIAERRTHQFSDTCGGKPTIISYNTPPNCEATACADDPDYNNSQYEIKCVATVPTTPDFEEGAVYYTEYTYMNSNCAGQPMVTYFKMNSTCDYSGGYVLMECSADGTLTRTRGCNADCSDCSGGFEEEIPPNCQMSSKFICSTYTGPTDPPPTEKYSVKASYYTDGSDCSGLADELDFHLTYTCTESACGDPMDSSTVGSEVTTCATTVPDVPGDDNSVKYFVSFDYDNNNCHGNPRSGDYHRVDKCMRVSDDMSVKYTCSGNTVTRHRCSDNACSVGCVTNTYTANSCIADGGESVYASCASAEDPLPTGGPGDDDDDDTDPGDGNPAARAEPLGILGALASIVLTAGAAALVA